MVEPARNVHEQGVDAKAGRLEEVTVSMFDLRKAMSGRKRPASCVEGVNRLQFASMDRMVIVGRHL
jgi:hypothetical protein